MRPFPIDHYDDLSVLYEPPSEDDLIRNMQGDIDSLTLNLIERDERIQDLREQQDAKRQPWWTN